MRTLRSRLTDPSESVLAWILLTPAFLFILAVVAWPVAIGVSGLNPLADYRGQQDTFGQTMHASILAVAITASVIVAKRREPHAVSTTAVPAHGGN